jgi:hypothetical protein
LKKYKTILGLLGCLWAAGAAAQTEPVSKPYLVAASIEIAADTQADLWLNGIYIGHCPHTTMSTGFKTIEARLDSLCYFKSTNVLAIRVEDAQKHSGDGFIGVAYAVQLKLSDGTVHIVNSSATQDHRCLYLPRRNQEEPDGWQGKNFDDSGWPTAQSSGDMMPNTTLLSDVDFGGVANFLNASANGYMAQYHGERQLFRRPFNLDISTNPRCMPKSFLAPPVNSWSNDTLPFHQIRMSPTPTPVLPLTPQVLPVSQLPLAATPQLGSAPPALHWELISINTLPTPVSGPLYSPRVYPPTPTAIPTPMPAAVQPAPAWSVYTAPTPTVILQNDGSIVFGASNANILVSFGDGPGIYKVEVMDDHFTHLKTLFDQRVLENAESWLNWNGKDESGNDVPAGSYYVICSKEGTVLQKITLSRRAQ